LYFPTEGDRFALDPPVARTGEGLGDAEGLDPLVGLGEVGVVRQEGERGAELGPVHQHARGADLGDGDLGELVLVVEQRLVQLAQAAHAEGEVRRPVGAVEGGAGGPDRAPQIGRRRVGGDAEHRLVGGVDVLVDGTTLGLGELAVDEQPLLVPRLPAQRHRAPGVDRCIGRRPYGAPVRPRDGAITSAP
jgi:hypothetical protein